MSIGDKAKLNAIEPLFLQNADSICCVGAPLATAVEGVTYH